MRLSKNIFEVTEENIDFLCYLRDHPQFKINEICTKFDLGYTMLANHLREWVNQGYIVKKKLPPKLGGYKYEYHLSERAINKLKDIKERL